MTEYEDTAEADSTEEAVFVGESSTGKTVIIGHEGSEEWIVTEDMTPLDLEETA